MGRGLGPLQRAAIEYLEDSGGWGWVSDLVAELEDRGKQPSRALEVSVRRAVKGLQQRGLLRTGYHRLGEDWETAKPLQLLIWLPGVEAHVRDLLAPRRQWVAADHDVLRVLREISQSDVDAWLAGARGVRGYGPSGQRTWPYLKEEPPWVPYQLAARRIAEALDGCDARGRITIGASRAIRRAILRLARQDLIRLRQASGDQVRLLEAVQYLPPESVG